MLLSKYVASSFALNFQFCHGRYTSHLSRLWQQFFHRWHIPTDGAKAAWCKIAHSIRLIFKQWLQGSIQAGESSSRREEGSDGHVGIHGIGK